MLRRRGRDRQPRLRRTRRPTGPGRAAAAVVVLLALGGCAQPQPDLELQVRSSTGVGPTEGTTGPPAPGVATGPRGPGRAPGAASGCPAADPSRTYTVAEVNTLMRRLNPPQWRAADVGATAALSDGRIAWIFGDTLRPDDYDPLIGDNSMMISSGTCFSQVVLPGMGSLIDLGKADHACWPASIAAVPIAGGDRLYVSCSRVKRPPGGLLGFTYLGATLATFTVQPGRQPLLDSVTELTPDSTDEKQINWGAALLYDHGWLYLYGSQRPGSGKAVYLARTRPGQTAKTNWQYARGSSWVSDPAGARALIPSSPGVSQAFSVHRIGQKYVLVSKRDGDWGSSIGVWAAAAPLGPWREQSRTPYPYDDGSGFVAYQPLGHPELRLSNGKLLVSMSRNPKKFADLRANPLRGRPVFVEVPQP